MTLVSTAAPNGLQDLVGYRLDGELPGALEATINTGVDSNGNLLPDGAIDPWYTIVSSPDGTGPAAYVTLQNGWPLPSAWIPDGPNSKWISPTADQSYYSSYGQYDYQTTMDLTGYDWTTAMLTGQISVDDPLVDILVDGVSTGITDQGHEFGSFTPYTVGSSFFHPGVNTIDFLVVNLGGPTGLRNEMTLTTAPAPGTTIPPEQSGNGIPGGDFFVDFVIDASTRALPTPLVDLPPAGAQLQQTPYATSGTITAAGDTDDFTITLIAGQKATVEVTAGPGLIPIMTLLDPNGDEVGTADDGYGGWQ